MLLKNATGEVSRIGYTVKHAVNDPLSFVYSVPGDSNIIGIITQAVPRYAQCEIATAGQVKVFCAESVVQGSTIRAAKASDHISRATCKSAKSTDTPYFSIGTALESGKGLVKCSLNLSGGSASADYVPYTGAISDVDLGSNDLTVTNITATGNITAKNLHTDYLLLETGDSLLAESGYYLIL